MNNIKWVSNAALNFPHKKSVISQSTVSHIFNELYKIVNAILFAHLIKNAIFVENFYYEVYYLKIN